MSERYRIPNFRKLYPEASDAVIAVLKKTERQMQYREHDIKSEVVKVDQREKTVTYIPSREDSLERLCENSRQFAADQLSVEDEVLRRLMHQNLYNALHTLSEDEQLAYCPTLLFWQNRARTGRTDGSLAHCHPQAQATDFNQAKRHSKRI